MGERNQSEKKEKGDRNFGEGKSVCVTML